MERYKDEFSERGYGEARVSKFDAALEDVLKKDAAQKSAQAVMQQRTQEQNETVEKALMMITMVQNAAKAAFGRDTVRLKEFKVGTEKGRSVKRLITMLEYFTGVVQKYSAELMANPPSADRKPT
jgi:hypothetical protein